VTPQGALAIDDLSAIALETPGLPAPRATAGHFAEASRFNEKIVTAEGYVDSQVEIDSGHLRLSLIIEGRSTSATIQLEEGSPVPQLQGALVRLQGLYVATRYPDGGVQNIELWVPQFGLVQICGWLGADPRFAQPLVPMDRLADLPSDTLVKVRGMVHRLDAGHSFVLGGADTEITVQTPQVRGLRVGMQLDAIGFVGVSGLNHFLRDALWKPAETGSSDKAAMPTEHRPKLRQATQVLELPPDQARLGYPVELRGVVIWSAPGDRCFYLRDPSRSIAVRIPLGSGIPAPAIGASLVVKGRSSIGSFAPEVMVDQLERRGSLALPDPRIVTLEQALTGTEESQRIELTGFLRNLREDTTGTVLDLTSSTGEFTARVPPGDYLREMFGSVVRVAGVCVARVNDRRQLSGVELLVASSDDVRLEETAPADPFDVPAKSIASLRAYGPPSTLGHLVRTSGVVLQHVPGRYLVIQDADESLQVLSRSPTPLQIGARVDVVGFPGRDGGRINLREGLYRQTGSGPEPEPNEVRAADAATPELDGHLVRMVATLIDVERSSGSSHLLLQDGRTTFGASLRGPAPGPSMGKPGSTLAVRGICRVQFDEYHLPRGFELELRSSSDVVVLAQPAWWTINRALSAASGLALCSLLVMLWVAQLRRRVNQQTATIRTQLEQQTLLEKELQRASKLESLGVLAGGIAHDFNNLLTIILCNVSLAQTNAAVVAAVGECLRDAERGARRARSLTLQLLTFAKGGDPLRAAVSLTEIVRESAGFVLRGSTVGCEFDFAQGLWAADADRDQIGQVVHNLVLNATQAMPEGGRVHLSLTNERLSAHAVGSLPAGRYVRLTVADSGPGIPAELLPKIFDPYFSTKKAGSGLGLATVYSIVRKHKGHIGVSSAPGKGTTFQVWLPAASETAAPAPVEPTPPPPLASLQLKGRRILAMDDDEDIRHLLVATLRKFEFEVEAVRDGDEAVQLYSAERSAGRPFDLVIMDLTVPGGTGGLEAMERLLKIDPAVLAIVCSGYSNAPVLANYRAYGFCAMVSKPYEVEELTGAVTRALAEREAKNREGKAEG
jgi:signal transduction histidine kinase/ActR/RegA family two-component response regulator